MTGDSRIMELAIMRAETRRLIALWRRRGVDWDVIEARLHQAALDVASDKHAEQGNGRNGKRRETQP